MFRKSLTLLSFFYLLICPLCVFGQSKAKSVLDHSNYWMVVTDNRECDGHDAKYVYHWAFADSVVDGNSYRIVTVCDRPPCDMFYVRYEDFPGKKVMCYREDGGKLYRYDNLLEKEIQVYDFDLSLDQEVTNGDGVRLKVTEVLDANDLVDDWALEGTKAFRLQGIDNPSYEDLWIEGAGSIHTGILLPSDFPKDRSADMVLSPRTRTSRFSRFDKIEPVLLEYAYEEWENDDRYVEVEFLDDTLRITGKMICFYSVLQMFRCHLDDGVIVVSSIYMDPLGVLVDGRLQCFYDVKFPGFEAGTYTIRIYPPLLQDGTEYKDIVLTCYGTPTDIRDHNSQPFQTVPSTTVDTNALYDLSGRKLTHTPDRGFYIQNGKKRIVK